MSVSRERAGELFMLGEICLWSLFPIITILAISTLPSLYSASLSTFFSFLFFGCVFLFRRKWHEFRCKVWKEIIISSILVGILFYSLVFIGIKHTTAGNASIVALMEILFSFIILGLWKKEKIIPKQVLGAGLMVLGAFIVLFKGSFIPNKGDVIILIATTIPPIGTYFMQQARKEVSAVFLMVIRSFISFIAIGLLALFIEPTIQFEDIKNSVPFLIINGVLLLGLSKIFWIEATHRIPITKAMSLAATTPVITLFFAFFILGEIPTVWQVLALIPMVFGVLFVIRKRSAKKLRNYLID